MSPSIWKFQLRQFQTIKQFQSKRDWKDELKFGKYRFHIFKRCEMVSLTPLE